MKTGSESVGELSRTAGQPSPGDWVGKKYRLKELRGAGGMGTVWVAHNTVLDIDVALKLMRFDQFRADPKRIFRRLLQEARAAARLEHPAIVRVFDFGLTDSGSPYIVMELLHGESLAELMCRQPAMEATRAVQLLLPIADALATAHGRGIIHRDIKPENLFLATDEYGRLQPKIVDFGVARFLEGGRTMTRSGALMGTPDYMAPEQARGEADIDTRVDIWALCVVLYELIAGFRPFGGRDANYLAVLRAIVHDAPNPEIKDIADDALWLILERGLRKKTHERWDTMRVLGEALALWLYERGVKEDILGASIKATWLQSGLGGVKIETASMSPPPGAHHEIHLAESGSLPVLSEAAVDVPPRGQVSVAAVRPPLRTVGRSLPSPAQLPPGSLSDFGNALLLPTAHDSDIRETSPDAIDVEFTDSEPPTEPVEERRSTHSSPLVQQTLELRRLVIASISITALLALAVVVLLWDQRRSAQPNQPTTPNAVPEATAPMHTASPPSAHAAPAPSLQQAAASTSATAPSTDEATNGTATAPSAQSPTLSVKKPAAQQQRRTFRPKKKTRYELGF